MTSEDTELAVKLIRRGCTRAATAIYLGTNVGKLGRVLRKAGLPNGRPGRPSKDSPPPNPAQEPWPADCVVLHRAGFARSVLAQVLRIDPDVYRRAVAAAEGR